MIDTLITRFYVFLFKKKRARVKKEYQQQRLYRAYIDLSSSESLSFTIRIQPSYLSLHCHRRKEEERKEDDNHFYLSHSVLMMTMKSSSSNRYHIYSRVRKWSSRYIGYNRLTGYFFFLLPTLSFFFFFQVQKAGGLLGVTSRGLLILTILLLIILLLFIIIVVLAALWPRTKAQEAPRVCDTPACLRAAAQVSLSP